MFFQRHKTEIIWQSLGISTHITLALLLTHIDKGITTRDVLSILTFVAIEYTLMNLIANWLMVKRPPGEQPLAFLAGLIGLFLGYLVIRYLTAFPDYLDPLNTYQGEKQPRTLSFFFFSQIVSFLLTIVFGVGIRLYKNGIQAERRARRLENEINVAKLQMLKHQINPHFLYNTLSYMYAQARPLSDNLSKSILMLADMMRYSLNKADEQGLTPITREISYIENYIKIHQLRFDSSFSVNFDIEGIIDGRKIVPLLLITFVENAFKHGKLTDPHHPVNIRLSVDKRQLRFRVKNYKQSGPKERTSGIGLENTHKRLQLAYPNQHTLTIRDESTTFEVDLLLNFTNP